MLRFGGVATGAVAGSVAEGVAQALKASVQKGQELRRGQDGQDGPFVAIQEGYPLSVTIHYWCMDSMNIEVSIF